MSKLMFTDIKQLVPSHTSHNDRARSQAKLNLSDFQIHMINNIFYTQKKIAPIYFPNG